MEKKFKTKHRRGAPITWAMDTHVAGRIRTRRHLLGLTQGELASKLGLTFQQIQKYENGSNRITAGLLYYLALHLDVPITFFYDAYEQGVPRVRPSAAEITRKEARLLRFWRDVPDDIRDQLLELIRLIGGGKCNSQE